MGTRWHAAYLEGDTHVRLYKDETLYHHIDVLPKPPFRAWKEMLEALETDAGTDDEIIIEFEWGKV